MQIRNIVSSRTSLAAFFGAAMLTTGVALGGAAGVTSVEIVDVVGVPVEAAERDVPDEPAPTIGDAISPAEVADLKTIAEQTGETFEEAVGRVAWQQDFAMLVTEIRSAFPDDVAGARIDEGGNPSITFRGAVPSVVAKQVEKFNALVLGSAIYVKSGATPFSVALLDDAGYSEGELDAQLTAAHFAVLRNPAVLDATSGYDTETGKILLEIKFVRGAAAESLKALLSELAMSGIDVSRVSI